MQVDPLQAEPPTNGRIQLRTSMGDVTVVLWSKEAPKACRNIIQLALEGYYEDQIFHRIVKDFIVQTGDPTGTGRGGSSIYPEGTFEDEFHHRLKFVRRGLVAMANSATRNSNESQFFITLGPTPELQGKHTIFGKVEGPGIYTVLSISEVEIADKETGRPRFPPKLLGIDVLDNPFEDIKPRTTSAEQQAQRERAKREREAVKEKKRKAEQEAQGGGAVQKKKKVAALLSFGEDGEEQDAGAAKAAKDTKLNRKIMSSHDALGGARPGEAPPSTVPQAPKDSKANRPEPSVKALQKQKMPEAEQLSDLSSLRASHQSGSAKSKAEQDIARLEASIRGGMSRDREKEEEERHRKKKEHAGKEWLEEQRAKYASGKKSGESDSLRQLKSFQAKLRAKEIATENKQKEKAKREELVGDEEIFPEMREYGMSDEEEDDDDWASFRAHRFEVSSEKRDGDGKQGRFSVDDYEVIDPRTTSKLALELGFGGKDARKKYEEERKQQQDGKQSGRQGRDWVSTESRVYKNQKPDKDRRR